MRDRGSGVIAWIALIIAIIALALSWVTYNRTGPDLEDRIQQQVQESGQQTQEAVQDGAQNAEDGVREGAQNLDQGPDGVDENDTDTNGGTTTPQNQ
ncbi:hypothetical protein CYG49_00240 [Candidatus Saccharibacteria bacterium]|nr:MAG: hypothetical protein CYG49_00240 [Candidatus Saccharibacteria bacterium]